jgi:hypothetical protein
MALSVSNSILPPDAKVGVPTEIDFSPSNMEKALPTGTRSYMMNVLPTGQNSFASGTLTTGNTANTGVNYSFPGGTVIFDVPCSQSRSSYIDVRNSYLKFRANYRVESANTGASSAFVANVRGGGASIIQRYTALVGGIQMFEIGEHGVLYDTLTKVMLNQSDRTSGFGTVCLGMSDLPYAKSSTNANKVGNSGHFVNNFTTTASGLLTVGNEYHSYSLPLLDPLIGSLATQFCPIGKLPSLQIQAQLDTILPLTYYPTTVATTAGTFSATYDQWELVLTVIDFGAEAEKVLEASSIIGGKQYWKSVSYRASTATIASSTGGTNDILIGCRSASCKAVLARNYFSSPSANSVNDKYDSFNVALDGLQLQTGGVLMPNKPLNPNQSPASVLAELQKAFSALNLTIMNTAVSPLNYAKSTHAPSTSAIDYSVVSTTTQATTAQNPAEFIVGIDTEMCAKTGLLTGINTLSSPVFMRYNISGTTGSAISVIFHMMHDVIFQLDFSTGQLYVSS